MTDDLLQRLTDSLAFVDEQRPGFTVVGLSIEDFREVVRLLGPPDCGVHVDMAYADKAGRTVIVWRIGTDGRVYFRNVATRRRGTMEIVLFKKTFVPTTLPHRQETSRD